MQELHLVIPVLEVPAWVLGLVVGISDRKQHDRGAR